MQYKLLISFLLVHLFSIASHIVGGEIYYDYLGNNQYRISVALYRDCNSSGAEYDDPLSLGIFTSSNQLVKNELIAFTGSVQLPITFANPCVIPPNDICIEKTVYVAVVTLPPVNGGYTLAYQRCCRGPNVVNLIAPDDTGITLSAHIPGAETGFTSNGSPRFSNYPPVILCNNDELIFNHSASDPDGDQLVYSLVAPYAGANSAAPMPNPPPAPPYTPVAWGSSFSSPNPLGPGASIAIDPTTGLLTASPQMLGLFVVGIRVQEYRGGVLVGETIRDFLFRVINCNITMQATFPEQEDMSYFISYCQGLTVSFDNNSYGATNYLWDFGVPNTSTDVSTQFEPTFTYPVMGTYEVMLIANPGWSCTDTSIRTIIVNDLLEVSYTTSDSICIFGNSFNFNGSVVGTNQASYQWDFGTHASQATASTLDVNNIVFDIAGFIPVKLTGTIGTCVADFVDSIYIFDMAVAAFNPPPNYLCEGKTVSMINTSTNAYQYEWDFGVPNDNTDKSFVQNPTYTFSLPGSYQVQLISSSTGACRDTAYQNLIINEILDVSFTSQDSLCITGNNFDFVGTYVGSPTTVFSWDFGPHASIDGAVNLNVPNVVFDTSGHIPVTLTGFYANCVDTYTKNLFIFREPTVDFGIEPDLQCVPFTAHFIDLSVADAQLNYVWNLGEGTSSTDQNPIYLYDEVGSYDVMLTIWADQGCVDTFTVLKPSFIVVHPKPTSRFTFSPAETDICHPVIQFTDESIGATHFKYIYDGVSSSKEQNPAHTYTTDGTFFPKQIAINEFQCSDSSSGRLYIAPFMVYIPNAFTPDENEFNKVFYPVVDLDAVKWNLKIYNRWGELLFESTDQHEGWDGRYNGRMMQDGLYTYRLQYTSCDVNDPYHELSGHFCLLK